MHLNTMLRICSVGLIVFFIPASIHNSTTRRDRSDTDLIVPAPSECTTGVISGEVTPDGRPLLFKTRDVRIPDQEFAYFDDGEYSYVTIISAGREEDAWGGVNSVGFAIENSTALNFPDTVEGSDDDGRHIKLALQTCRTVDDFAVILDSTNNSGRTTPSNYGVIDAEGVAAIFEAGAGNYIRLDAADTTDAPDGFMVRANFAYTGGEERHIGQWRHDRAYQLILDAADEEALTPQYLLRTVILNLCLEDLDPYPLPFDSVYAGRDWPTGFIPTHDMVNRDITASAVVVQGVMQDEEPLLATFFGFPGQPILTVPLPLWVRAASTPQELDGDPTSLLCDLSNLFKDYVYNTHIAVDALNTFQLLDGQGGGLLTVTGPVTDSIFTRSQAAMEDWREDMPEPGVMADFQNKMAEYAYETLREWRGKTLFRVPDDYEIIQEAIDASSDGDTVLVLPGVYAGSIDFKGRNIVLGSLFITTGDYAYIDSTVIDGGQDDRCVAFNNGEDEDAILTGFTLQNGATGFGGGIYCNGAGPTLSRLLVKDNQATRNGGGIYCTHGSSPTLIQVTVVGNSANGESGGIYCYDNSVPIITNSIFWDNSPHGIPAGLSVSYSDIQNGYEGEGNINRDPLFSAPEIGDYHLTEDSPCLDAGDPESGPDPDGTRADMGTFYLHQQPDISVEPDSLEFEGVQTETTDSLAVTISNVGQMPLQVTSLGICSYNAPFWIDEPEDTLNIEPDSSYTVWVMFRPYEENEYFATLIIESNDPDEPAVEIPITGTALEVKYGEGSLPTEFAITGVHPNPFNASTVVTYTVPKPGTVALSLYDLSGREVAVLSDGFSPAGRFNAIINADNLATGIYILRLSGADDVRIGKVTLIR